MDFDDFLNYVACSWGINYWCNMNNNTFRALPVPFHAFAIGPYHFLAADCLLEMLWVLSWRELPPYSRPIRGKLWRRFHPRNRFWQPQTSPSFGPPTCSNQKLVVHELLCEFATEFQLTHCYRSREKCMGKPCIYLNKGKHERKNPYPPVLCTDWLLQWDWGVP